MYVVSLNYIVPLAKIDEHMAGHVKFLRKYYKLNKFIASGRKVPRTGGVILALADSRDELDAILREDPFHQHHLADFAVIEFQTSQHHPDLADLLAGHSKKK